MASRRRPCCRRKTKMAQGKGRKAAEAYRAASAEAERLAFEQATLTFAATGCERKAEKEKICKSAEYRAVTPDSPRLFLFPARVAFFLLRLRSNEFVSLFPLHRINNSDMSSENAIL